MTVSVKGCPDVGFGGFILALIITISAKGCGCGVTEAGGVAVGSGVAVGGGTTSNGGQAPSGRWVDIPPYQGDVLVRGSEALAKTKDGHLTREVI